MRPTKYNKRITVQKRTKDENEIGGWSNTWSTLYNSWASVKSASWTKKMEYGQLNYTQVYEVEMRKRNINVDSDCRVVYDSNNYQIVSFHMNDDRVYLTIAR